MTDTRSGFYSYDVGQPGPLGKKIQSIIIRATDYIVYIDEDGDIQYSCVDGKHDPLALGEIQNLVSLWETTVNRIFDEKEALAYKGLLAEAYARVLDGSDAKQAHAILHRTTPQIERNGGEILKQVYIIASFWTTLAIIGFGALVMYSHYRLPCLWNQSVYEMLLVSLCGGIGAFVFATLRLRTYTPDIHVNKTIHRMDGRMRVFYGMIAGFIICLGIRSNVLLGFVGDAPASFTLQAFLGIIAGASEVIIPNIIRQVEQKG